MLSKISVKIQSVAVLLSLVVFMLSTLTFVFLNIVTKDFKQLELAQANRNIFRSKEVYQLILDGYSKKIVDWGNWDDTYKFISDLNSEYIISNLGQSSLESLEVDMMTFYDQTAEFKHGVSSTNRNIPDDIKNILKTQNNLLTELDRNNESSGLIQTQNGLALYSAHTILKSDGSGPKNGYMFFIRYIDVWFTNSIAQTLQIPIKFNSNKTKMDDDHIETSKENIVAYFSLPIKNSDQSLNLLLEMNREIWTQVLKTAKQLLTTILSAIVVGVFVNYTFYNLTLVRDLKTLQDEVSVITKNNGQGEIKSTGKSLETVKLRSDINILIDLIYKAKVTAETRASEINKINNLMIDREVKMTELKEIIYDLKKKII